MIPLCDLHAEYLACKKPIDEAIARVIDSSAFILGKEVEQFEKAWAERCGIAHCVAVSNCTDALYLSLKMLGIDQGYQVLVPAMTVTADAEAVIRCGAEPVICDVDEGGMITLEHVQKRDYYGHLAAVILVHLHGKPCPETAAIAEWCRDKQRILIEDCAHAHGADVGKHGDTACWSFFPSKILGCMGDAGAITFGPTGSLPSISGYEQAENELRAMRNHGRRPGEKHLHETDGGNYRMDGMQAAILHAKLTAKPSANCPQFFKHTFGSKEVTEVKSGENVIDFGKYGPIRVPITMTKTEQVPTFFEECLFMRRSMAWNYDQAFGVESALPPIPSDELTTDVSSHYVYAIQHERRDELATFLRERGIQTGQHYPVPLHKQPVYEPYGYKCPGADEFARKTLSLPLSPFLSHEDQQRVIDSVKEFGL